MDDSGQVYFGYDVPTEDMKRYQRAVEESRASAEPSPQRTFPLTPEQREKLYDPIANAHAAVAYIERRYADAGRSLKEFADALNEEAQDGR